MFDSYFEAHPAAIGELPLNLPDHGVVPGVGTAPSSYTTEDCRIP
jgi:hypothetical protein